MKDKDMNYKDAAAGPAVELYDFRRPDTISKEHERILGIFAGNFARYMVGTLSTQLRGMTRIGVESVREMEYQQFMHELPAHSLMVVCAVPPLDGKILFTLDPHISLALVDQLLGGPGEADGPARELTEIEMVLLRQVVKRLLLNLRETLENIIKVEPEIEQFEANTAYVQLVSSTVQVVSVLFKISLSKNSGHFRMVLPYQVMQTLLPLLQEHFWLRSKSSSSDRVKSSPEMRRLAANIPVEISVQLGAAEIALSDLLNLAAGDYIVLKSGRHDELPIYVAGRKYLWGRLGRCGEAYAVAVTRWDDTLAEESAAQAAAATAANDGAG